MTALNLKDLVGLTLFKHWTIVSMKDRGEGATGSKTPGVKSCKCHGYPIVGNVVREEREE